MLCIRQGKYIKGMWENDMWLTPMVIYEKQKHIV